MRALLLTILMIATTAARADDDALRKQIVGLWTLVSVVYEDQATKERTPVLGQHPRAGLLVLHIGAALYHYFIRRDGVLQRMLP
jgi:cytochrome b561